MPKLKSVPLECEDCKLGKSRRISFKPSFRIRSKKPLQLLHMDTCGPLPTVSNGGSRYFLTIIDDF